MTEFELEQLRRLPQRESDTWQGGWCRYPFRLSIAGEEGGNFRLAFWASLESGQVNRVAEPVRVGETTPAHLFSALVRFAIDRRVAGHRPGRVQVADRELADVLGPPLGRAGIVVELVPGPAERLPALAPVLAAMREEFADRGTGAAMTDAPGVTVGRMRAFSEAAREFYLARPWERLDGDTDPIRIVTPEPDPTRGAVVVMGAAGETFGLGFFASVEQFQRMVTAAAADDEEESEDLATSAERWSVAFGDFEDLPYEDGDTWRQHDLPIAGEEAWPLLLHVRPPYEFLAPGPADLAFMEAILRAVARATEEQLDRGRWNLTVPTFDGPVAVELELPELLVPPDRRKLIARGWEPDRRAFERLQLIIDREMAENRPRDIEEANALLTRKLGHGPIPDLPFEPRDDWESAQELCYQAFDAQGRRRVALARRALAVCPDCADAYVLLAEYALTSAQAHALYEAGAAAGPRHLSADFLAHFDGNLWSNPRGRPWLRALNGQARTLSELGRKDEAIAVGDELLRLDREDHQGLRETQLILLLEAGRDADAEPLLARFADNVPDHDEGFWFWADALIAFRLRGDTPASAAALARARATNRHVPRFLKEPEPIRLDEEENLRPGQLGAAQIVAGMLHRFWRETPGALEWALAKKSKPVRLTGGGGKGSPKGRGKTRGRG
jgi:tetratricopeptide (TPR) repeat protein